MAEQTVNQEPSPVQSGKKFLLSRRAFLGASFAAVAGAFLPQKNFTITEPQIDKSATEESILNSVPQVESIQTENEINMGIIKIYLDANNNPVSYIFNYGEKQYFTEEEKLYLFAAKQQAEQTGEVEPALQFREFGVIPPQVDTPERPHISLSPEGMLTPEQLQAYNVEIINPSKETSPQLFLRESAFQDSGLLEPLRVLNENLSPGEEKFKLKLVVFDGEFVTSEYLLQPEYEEIFPLVSRMEESVDSYIKNKIKIFERNIAYWKQSLAKMNPGEEEYDQLKAQILDFKVNLLLYSRTLKTTDVIAEAYQYSRQVREASTPIGQHHRAVESNARTAHIMIAAPSAKETVGQRIHSLTYSPDGSLNLISMDRIAENGAIPPRADQGFPQPGDFKEYSDSKRDNNDYRFEPYTIGYVARHELAHFDLITVLPELGKRKLMFESKGAIFIRNIPEVAEFVDQEKAGSIDPSFPATPNEWLTDTVAYASIADAAARWEKSGYTDNSGFSVVFKIPESPYQLGGYQLTDFSGKEVIPAPQAV